MSNISLSKAVRSNLLSLQGTASMMAKTQERLSTGNKVNSALDNPTSFFTAQSLNSRAGDLNSLMDGMANGIQTLEAADNGLTSITKTVESMQSSIRQARQDKSFAGTSYSLDPADINTTTVKNLSFSGGSVGSTPVDVALNTASASAAGGYMVAQNAWVPLIFDQNHVAPEFADISVTVDGVSKNIFLDRETVQAAGGDATDGVSLAEAISTINAQSGVGLTASNDGGKLRLTSNTTGPTSSVLFTAVNVFDNGGGANDLSGAEDYGIGTPTYVAGVASGTASVKSIDTLVADINAKTELVGKVRASNDGGKLRIENLATSQVNIDGVTAGGTINGTSSGAAKVNGNSVRADLIKQFNDLRQQLDRTSEDASFNGINLLRGDALKLTFNETGSSSLTIQAKNGKSINSTNLGITNQATSAADTDASLDAILDSLSSALGSLRSQASSFGSNLSQVQNRQDFTKGMVNTLQTGAANLTLADMNGEAANLLALQTRQSLSQSALSLASQADQSVLQLLR